MPPSNKSNVPQPPEKSGSSLKSGQRFILSARAQTALTLILEELIEEALKEASRMAESAGKRRVELAEVEAALRVLCERYHARWEAEAAALAAADRSKNASTNPGSCKPSTNVKPPKRL
ncbi:hypothetical protein QAD02_014966 [Eretmocerus hayati]|uniref:Uncharacterized protein n=1 Tax=Eretmocerus hayati TaxID=131215 RepID=A0ACC2P6G1_9HYME|nr:hypothetical protein QAD02_014966 [Eretmocerus hayati]